MKRFVGSLLVVGLFLMGLIQFGSFSSVADVSEFYVDSAYRGFSDGSAERPFKSIQVGIDEASVGDTVYVFGGSYDESFVVNKRVTLWGSIDEIPSVIDVSSDVRYTVEVTADFAEVQAFTFSDAGDHKSSPIGALLAVKADNVIVQSNMFNETKSYGIYLDGSGDGSVVSGNWVNNTKRGICVDASNTNDIFYNVIGIVLMLGFYW